MKSRTMKKPATSTKKEGQNLAAHDIAWKKAFMAWIRTPIGKEIPEEVVNYYKDYHGVILS